MSGRKATKAEPSDLRVASLSSRNVAMLEPPINTEDHTGGGNHTGGRVVFPGESSLGSSILLIQSLEAGEHLRSDPHTTSSLWLAFSQIYCYLVSRFGQELFRTTSFGNICTKLIRNIGYLIDPAFLGKGFKLTASFRTEASELSTILMAEEPSIIFYGGQVFYNRVCASELRTLGNGRPQVKLRRKKQFIGDVHQTDELCASPYVSCMEKVACRCLSHPPSGEVLLVQDSLSKRMLDPSSRLQDEKRFGNEESLLAFNLSIQKTPNSVQGIGSSTTETSKRGHSMDRMQLSSPLRCHESRPYAATNQLPYRQGAPQSGHQYQYNGAPNRETAIFPGDEGRTESLQDLGVQSFGSQIHGGDPSSDDTGELERRPYPCVFHEWNGEADSTPHCRTLQAYVSRLVPHHRRRHPQYPGPFLYCTKCFRIDFTDEQEFSVHQSSQRCIVRCVTEGCRNYDGDPPYVNLCTHGLVNSQRFLWKKLYRLARGLDSYADIPDPGLLDDPAPAAPQRPQLQSQRNIQSTASPPRSHQPIHVHPQGLPANVNRYVDIPHYPSRPSSPDSSVLPPPDVIRNFQHRSRQLHDYLVLLGSTLWRSVNQAYPQRDDMYCDIVRDIVGTIEDPTDHSHGGLTASAHFYRLRQLLRIYNRVITDSRVRSPQLWGYIVQETRSCLPRWLDIPPQMPWVVNALTHPSSNLRSPAFNDNSAASRSFGAPWPSQGSNYPMNQAYSRQRSVGNSSTSYPSGPYSPYHPPGSSSRAPASGSSPSTYPSSQPSGSFAAAFAFSHLTITNPPPPIHYPPTQTMSYVSADHIAPTTYGRIMESQESHLPSQPSSNAYLYRSAPSTSGQSSDIYASEQSHAPVESVHDSGFESWNNGNNCNAEQWCEGKDDEDADEDEEEDER